MICRNELEGYEPKFVCIKSSKAKFGTALRILGVVSNKIEIAKEVCKYEKGHISTRIELLGIS